MRRSLRGAIAAGRDDLAECAEVPGYPLPFARLADSPLEQERP